MAGIGNFLNFAANIKHSFVYFDHSFEFFSYSFYTLIKFSRRVFIRMANSLEKEED